VCRFKAGHWVFQRQVSHMAIASERGHSIFRKTEKDIRRIVSDLNPDSVHRCRTTIRRLQTLLEELLLEPTRNQNKLIQILDRIRKRAGRVRDIDVQLSALRSLKASQEPRRKSQLAHSLIELRVKHEKKLSKLLKKNLVREIGKRLRKASKEVELDAVRDPMALARQIISPQTISRQTTASVAHSTQTADEAALHQYRLAVKRARYAAEFGSPSRERTQFIAQLKKYQHALGSWHDWHTLTNTAVERFGEVNQSSLVAALQNVVRGKFRQAVAVLPGAASSHAPKVAADAHPAPERQSAA
jgi:CHAD domain-containing protein